MHLRYGILSEVKLNLNNIAGVELNSHLKEVPEFIKKLSPLGDMESHNIIITLSQEQDLVGLYGMKKKFKSIAFHIDQPKLFKTEIDALIIQ